MNTKYEKELNRICLHIHVPEIYEEDYQMPMLRANKIPGILEVNGCGIDGESRYTYEITGLVSMAVLFENKQVQKGDIEQFIYCLLESISQLQKYMLHPGCLLLEPEYVFCRKQKYFFCYLPGGKQELCESFHRMTEYFVESAWKKAAHKISRGRLGRWGSWDDLILETNGQDESTHL